MNYCQPCISDLYSEKIEIEHDYMDTIRTVCQKFGCSYFLLKSDCKKSEIVKARYMVIYLLRRYTTFSLKYIGSLLGGRDHSTISVAYSKTVLLIHKNKYFRDELEGLEKQIFEL